MQRTITQKILESHLVSSKKDYTTGREGAIRIDQILTPDSSGTMVFQEFETLGVEQVKTELSVSYIHHHTVQMGPESADDHRYLQTAAAKYGVLFSKAGNGICHQVHLERFAVPGKTLLGPDSHTPDIRGNGYDCSWCGGIGYGCSYGRRSCAVTQELKRVLISLRDQGVSGLPKEEMILWRKEVEDLIGLEEFYKIEEETIER